MNDKDFQLLCESIRQAGEIRGGKRKPSRTFVIENPKLMAIRDHSGFSQSLFARMAIDFMVLFSRILGIVRPRL